MLLDLIGICLLEFAEQLNKDCEIKEFSGVLFSPSVPELPSAMITSADRSDDRLSSHRSGSVRRLHY